MAHLFINDLKPGQQLNETYMITQPILRNTTRGDLYIAMYLSDRTGKANGRMWQVSESLYNQLPSEGFVQVRGKSELYQSAMQIVINDIRVIESDQVDLEDFMPKTDKDVAEMCGQVEEMLTAVKDPALKALIAAFLGDSELMKEFAAAPGGMQIHHAYLGGLLEHTHTMLAVATKILPLYPKVQADLVLTAVFLHDIAKTKELSYDVAFSYTDTGQLLGHLVLGTQMIKEKATIIEEQGTPLDKAVLDSLLHIVLSHHGQYDFGSPKLPATAEAFMIYYIDGIDARMNQVTNLIENDPGNTDWTAYQRTLETRLYKKRPLE